jgi:hypothetical protein
LFKNSSTGHRATEHKDIGIEKKWGGGRTKNIKSRGEMIKLEPYCNEGKGRILGEREGVLKK